MSTRVRVQGVCFGRERHSESDESRARASKELEQKRHIHMDFIRGRSFAIYSQLKKGRRYLGLETFQSNARKTHLSIKL